MLKTLRYGQWPYSYILGLPKNTIILGKHQRKNWEHSGKGHPPGPTVILIGSITQPSVSIFLVLCYIFTLYTLFFLIYYLLILSLLFLCTFYFSVVESDSLSRSVLVQPEWLINLSNIEPWKTKTKSAYYKRRWLSVIDDFWKDSCGFFAFFFIFQSKKYFSFFFLTLMFF